MIIFVFQITEILEDSRKMQEKTNDLLKIIADNTSRIIEIEEKTFNLLSSINN